YFIAEPGKVGGQNRWRNDERTGHSRTSTRVRVTRGGRWGNVVAMSCPSLLMLGSQPPRQRFQQVRQQINWKLRQREIKPCDIGHGKTGCRQHQTDVAVAGNQADREGARTTDAPENKSRDSDQAEREREGE